MNSIVKLTFLNNNKQVTFQLVYPNEANLKENKISFFSQVATALFSNEQKQSLFHNIAEEMEGVPDDVIQRQIELFDAADQEYGNGVKKALGM